MYITKPKDEFLNRQHTTAVLKNLIRQPSAREAPPCPSCHLAESSSAFNNSSCNCNCPNAAQALSSDPDKHPIESLVVPLVFELSSLRLMQPCWSCEGHNAPDNQTLWKLPQVHFYALSPIYVQLLANHVNRLMLDKRLGCAWRVSFSNFGQTWGITYTLEPNLNGVDVPPSLVSMQQDLQTISEGLADAIKREAGTLLSAISTT